jgi:hypothetical protein
MPVRWIAVRVGLLCGVLIACGKSDGAPPTTRSVPVRDAGTIGRAPCPSQPRELGSGLTAERWSMAATPATAGTACIDVVRADLGRYELRALTSNGGKPRTALAWRDAFGLVAVTNAGMFHANGDPVGLVVGSGSVHGVDNAQMSGFVAWDPASPGDPPVLAASRSCDRLDLATLRARYHSLAQSYRLLDCDGKALPWKDPKQYSAAAIGVDRAGRVVFIHARSAVTMAELSIALAAHDLTGAIFLEGGPEASLVVHGTAGDLELLGSYETHFVENDDNTAFWELPNVIGLVAR